MADAKVSLGDWPSATKLWDEALRLQKMTGNLNDIAVAETLSRRGRHLFKVRRYCESVIDLEKAVRIRTEELRHHQSNNSYLELSDTLIDLGRAQYMLENYVNSIQSLQTALARRIQVLGESDSRVADVFYEIATAYHRRKRYEEAQKSYRMAVLICREAGLGENHPTITRVLHRLADRNIIGEKFWQIASKI
jgi:tetratricopeptide (TPR) repeat protein